MASVKAFASLYCQAADGLKQKLKSNLEKPEKSDRKFENRKDPLKTDRIL